MATPLFDRSIFKTYFDTNDAELLAWIDAVLNKLTEEGIVAKYLLRQDQNDNPNDYEELYRPLVTFLGYIVRLAREFEGFKSNSFLADQYLLQHGEYTCGDETLDELTYLITNSLRRRLQRGTIRSLEKVDSSLIPDGEILALVCWNRFTFFKLGVAQPQHNSWNVQNSSPLFNGCTGRYDLNIGYEYTEDVNDLDQYPLLNTDYIFRSQYKSKICLEIEEAPAGEVAGIGSDEAAKRIVVDPDMNFEITFYVAQDITLEQISFGCLAFDIGGNPVNLQSVVDGHNKNFFFETRRLNKAGKFYFVRGILYNKDQENLEAEDARLNIGFGQNLRMPENVCSIIPYIVMDNDMTDDSDDSQDSFDSLDISYGDDSDSQDSTSDSYEGFSSIFLWNIKVTPCSLDYNRCYLNNKKFIDVITHNKNGKYNTEQIKDILRKKFIPNNTAFNLINLPRDIDAVVDLEFLLLEDGDHILLETGDKILLEPQS